MKNFSMFARLCSPCLKHTLMTRRLVGWRGVNASVPPIWITVVSTTRLHPKRAPSPDRLKAWKEGHAHLCHGYYSIEVKAQRIEDIPADELQNLIEKA